eukprot:994205-Rhodomonas_salina.3
MRNYFCLRSEDRLYVENSASVAAVHLKQAGSSIPKSHKVTDFPAAEGERPERSQQASAEKKQTPASLRQTKRMVNLASFDLAEFSPLPAIIGGLCL